MIKKRKINKKGDLQHDSLIDLLIKVFALLIIILLIMLIFPKATSKIGDTLDWATSGLENLGLLGDDKDKDTPVVKPITEASFNDAKTCEEKERIWRAFKNDLKSKYKNDVFECYITNVNCDKAETFFNGGETGEIVGDQKRVELVRCYSSKDYTKYVDKLNDIIELISTDSYKKQAGEIISAAQGIQEDLIDYRKAVNAISDVGANAESKKEAAEILDNLKNKQNVLSNYELLEAINFWLAKTRIDCAFKENVDVRFKFPISGNVNGHDFKSVRFWSKYEQMLCLKTLMRNPPPEDIKKFLKEYAKEDIKDTESRNIIREVVKLYKIDSLCSAIPFNSRSEVCNNINNDLNPKEFDIEIYRAMKCYYNEEGSCLARIGVDDCSLYNSRSGTCELNPCAIASNCKVAGVIFKNCIPMILAN